MAGIQLNQTNTLPWPLNAPESPVERRGANFGRGNIKAARRTYGGPDARLRPPLLLSNYNASDFSNVCSPGTDLSECGYERPPKLWIGF